MGIKPSVLRVESVRAYANASMVLIFDNASTDAKTIIWVKIVVRARNPLAIDRVLQIVSHVRQLIRHGLRVALYCPDRLEETELIASCTAATLDVPVAAVVGELAQLDWIDFGSFMQFTHDFLDAWNEREQTT